eukprot:XP_001697762.1 predicted protein [Chlamydomonas reinhardtii]
MSIVITNITHPLAPFAVDWPRGLQFNQQLEAAWQKLQNSETRRDSRHPSTSGARQRRDDSGASQGTFSVPDVHKISQRLRIRVFISHPLLAPVAVPAADWPAGSAVGSVEVAGLQLTHPRIGALKDRDRAPDTNATSPTNANATAADQTTSDAEDLGLVQRLIARLEELNVTRNARGGAAAANATATAGGGGGLFGADAFRDSNPAAAGGSSSSSSTAESPLGSNITSMAQSAFQDLLTRGGGSGGVLGGSGAFSVCACVLVHHKGKASVRERVRERVWGGEELVADQVAAYVKAVKTAGAAVQGHVDTARAALAAATQSLGSARNTAAAASSAFRDAAGKRFSMATDAVAAAVERMQSALGNIGGGKALSGAGLARLGSGAGALRSALNDALVHAFLL